MERKNSITYLTILVILLYLLSWYIKPLIYEGPEEYKTEISESIDYSEVLKRDSTLPITNRDYFIGYTSIINKRRSLIPFIYDRDTIHKTPKILKYIEY